MTSIDEKTEYQQLATELSDAVPEERLLKDFPLVFSLNRLRELRRAGQVRYILGPRGQIAYPPSEAVRLVRQRMVG